MPFLLLVVAVLCIVSGARGTYPQLASLLKSDFTGPHNFGNWVVALGALGLVGYVPELQRFSRAMLALVMIALFLSQRGFFTQFQAAIAGDGGQGNG